MEYDSVLFGAIIFACMFAGLGVAVHLLAKSIVVGRLSHFIKGLWYE